MGRKWRFSEETLSQHIAVLGKTGSGKTCTAKLIVEQVVAEDARVCVLDPIKSDWWGLTSSASGKKAGLPFQILGGPHGHVPLHESAGKAVAEVVANGSLPHSIIDMADFKPGGLSQFFTDFAPALQRRMKGVLYLVIEEAHEFAPKERSGVSKRDENMAIYYAKRLATSGRSKGIRLIVVTQRTQALHNAILGSCDTMIAHRLTAPADQKPVSDWLGANAPKDVTDEVKASLSGLKTGEGWLCSGEAQLFERRKFPMIWTYDNSRTPTGADGEHRVKTSPVDADGLRKIIGKAVEEAEANDPKKLKAEIARLKKELSTQKPQVDEQATERAVAAAVRDRDNHWQGEVRKLESALTDRHKRLQKIETLAHLNGDASIAVNVPETPQITAPTRQTPRRTPQTRPTAAVDRDVTSDFQPNGAQQRILNALAQLEAMGHSSPPLGAVGFLAGIKPTGGHFSNTVGPLSTHGLVDRSGGMMSLTGEGRSLAEQPEQDLSLEEYHNRIAALLKTGAQRKIFAAIRMGNGTEVTVSEIGDVAGIDPSGGHFSNSIGPLSTLGLIDRRSGVVHPTELMYPDGLA